MPTIAADARTAGAAGGDRPRDADRVPARPASCCSCSTTSSTSSPRRRRVAGLLASAPRSAAAGDEPDAAAPRGRAGATASPSSTLPDLAAAGGRRELADTSRSGSSSSGRGRGRRLHPHRRERASRRGDLRAARRAAARDRARRARVRILTPPALLRGSTSGSTLLTGGAQDLDERQRTLRGTIEWSYDLLLREEKTLFSRLGSSSAAAGSRPPRPSAIPTAPSARAPRRPRLARREEPPPPAAGFRRRAALLDARDDPRVRRSSCSTRRASSRMACGRHAAWTADGGRASSRPNRAPATTRPFSRGWTTSTRTCARRSRGRARRATESCCSAGDSTLALLVLARLRRRRAGARSRTRSSSAAAGRRGRCSASARCGCSAGAASICAKPRRKRWRPARSWATTTASPRPGTSWGVSREP